MLGVHAFDGIDRLFVSGRSNRIRSRDIRHWLRSAEIRALERCRQKSVTPVILRRTWHTTWIVDRNISRQFLILRSECIRHPGTDRGKPFEGKTGRHEILGSRVSAGSAVKRVEEAIVVHHAAQVRQQVRDHLSSLPLRFEVPKRFVNIARRSLKRHSRLPRSAHSVIFEELRFIIKCIDMANRSCAKDNQQFLC